MTSIQANNSQGPRSPGSNRDAYNYELRKAREHYKAGEYGLAAPHFESARQEYAKLAEVDRSNPELFSKKQAVANTLAEYVAECRKKESEGAKSAPKREPAPQKADLEGGTLKIEQLRIEPTDASLDNIIGHEQAKKAINRKLLVPLKGAKLAEKLGVGVEGGLLLYGPSGTGKTELARAVAGQMGYPCYKVNCADIRSKWVGEGEKNVAALFDQLAAERGPVVLVLDECDAIFGIADGKAHQAHVAQVAMFKERFDGMEKLGQVFFMAITNYPESIEDAILSRCGGRNIYMGLPAEEEREKILQLQFATANLSPSLDLSEIARLTHHYSGRDLKELAKDVKLEAVAVALDAGEDQELITRELFLEVLKDRKPKDKSAQIARLEAWKGEGDK